LTRVSSAPRSFVIVKGAAFPGWVTDGEEGAGRLAEPLHPANPATTAGTMSSTAARRQQLCTMTHPLTLRTPMMSKRETIAR
jgi:hypothetical protein